MNSNKTLLVVLNKNEELGLKEILPRINKNLFKEIICIDGNSTDNSAAVLDSFAIKVLAQNSSGRGAAFKLAFKYAQNRGFDYLLFFSSDGNEDPYDLEKFINLMDLNPDLIIASRMLPGSHNEEDDKFLRPRKMGNKVFSFFAWVTFSKFKSKYISDPINGFRALRFSSWSDKQFRSDNFSIEFEISIKAYKYNYKVVEFETKENERISGKSGARAIKTSSAMIKTLILEFFNK